MVKKACDPRPYKPFCIFLLQAVSNSNFKYTRKTKQNKTIQNKQLNKLCKSNQTKPNQTKPNQTKQNKTKQDLRPILMQLDLQSVEKVPFISVRSHELLPRKR